MPARPTPDAPAHSTHLSTIEEAEPPSTSAPLISRRGFMN